MKKIYLSSPHMSSEGYEQDFVQEAFDTNWVSPSGKNLDMFELEMAEMTGAGYAVALASGTAAIHLSLKAAGVRPGDVVLCQTLTFSASANPILYMGATPVFIDSEMDTWSMDPELLEQALQKYDNVKAVIVVHLYGVSAKIDRIKEICDKYDVALIEDAAESLGTIYKHQWTGTFGDYGIISFNGNKIITTSGGGMFLSNNEEAAKKVRFWSTQSREKERYYHHKEIGYNYRLSNISAGIGRGQLKVLEERVLKKRHIYYRYVDGLKDISEITFIPDHKYERSNHWLTAFTVQATKVTPKTIIEELDKHHIESRPVWKPMHMQPVFQEYDFVGNDVAEYLFVNGVCLPSDTKMTDEEIDSVIEIVKGLF